MISLGLKRVDRQVYLEGVIESMLHLACTQYDPSIPDEEQCTVSQIGQ